MDKPFVLLADDNEATCTLVTALLHHDFVVETATDGSEAIEKLKNRHYSVILLDLLMPVLDGFAVLDYLSQERPDLLSRVIVLTAAVSPRELQRVGIYKVCAVMHKPFEVDVLLAAVRQCAGAETSSRGPLLAGGMLMILADLLQR